VGADGKCRVRAADAPGRHEEQYFARFPDGRDRLAWPGLVYLRARPRWIRYSDYNRDPPLIVEFTQAELAAST
jgi:hypothetical protein